MKNLDIKNNLQSLLKLIISGSWLGVPLGIISLIGFLAEVNSFVIIIMVAALLSLPWGIPFLILMAFASFENVTKFDLGFFMFFFFGLFVVACININGALIINAIKAKNNTHE